MKRVPKGSSSGGQFTKDTAGKTAPVAGTHLTVHPRPEEGPVDLSGVAAALTRNRHLSDDDSVVSKPESVTANPVLNSAYINGDDECFTEIREALTQQLIDQDTQDEGPNSPHVQQSLASRSHAGFAQTPALEDGPLAATGHPFTFRETGGMIKPGTPVTVQELQDFTSKKDKHISTFRELTIAVHETNAPLKQGKYTIDTGISGEIMRNEALSEPVRYQALALVYGGGRRNVPGEWEPSVESPSDEVKASYPGKADWLDPFGEWLARFN